MGPDGPRCDDPSAHAFNRGLAASSLTRALPMRLSLHQPPTPVREVGGGGPGGGAGKVCCVPCRLYLHTRNAS